MEAASLKSEASALCPIKKTSGRTGIKLNIPNFSQTEKRKISPFPNSGGDCITLILFEQNLTDWIIRQSQTNVA